MEHSYQVMFSFQTADDDNWAFGTTQISTDTPINSVQALRDVGREIGKTHGYVKVVINSTIPPMENIEEVLSRKTTNAFGQVIDGGAKNEES